MDIMSVHKKKCTGCMECINICPVKCISITVDKEGFYIPKIDNEICMKCGKCYVECPTVNEVQKLKPIDVYAVQGKNKEEIRKSASGGVTYLLSEKVIDRGGLVYGCIYGENLNVIHSRAITKEQLNFQRGSKYVQSDFSSVFKSVLQDCKNDREVLVVGTPCQIAAIKSYLGKGYEKLLLVDLICHGVPSPKLFKDYIKWKEQKMGRGAIIKYNFRDKSNGWGTVYRAKVTTKTETRKLVATEDPYFSSFIYGKTFRESCYQCQYACEERVGDITVGDYWGVIKEHPEICDNMSDGISCVLVNTKKGKVAFRDIVNEVEFVKSSIDKVKVENSNLDRSANRPRVRNKFYINYNNHGFEWVNREMYKNKKFYFDYVKQRVPMGLKSKLKKIMRGR